MAKYDPELRAHRDWLGLLQPVGLVVSPPALVRAQAVPSQNVAELQQELLSVVERAPGSESVTDEPALTNLPAFFQTVLGWSLDDIAGASGGPPLPDGLELVLPDFHETLRPTYVALDSMGDASPLMLVQAVPRDTALDEMPDDDGRTGWSASPQAKLERLLREVKVPAGLLCNGDAMRLVYAPGGESSGHLTFPVAAMCEVSGRPILAALDMLLSEYRVFSAPDGRRLGDILSESRKYQAEVSNALSDQVLGALWELLRGFQASDPDDGRRIFDQTAREDPQHVYGGLLAVLMRLIFVLYAEDEGLMPEGEVYANNYSVSGLYERLRSDAGRYPDTMDQRVGAYAWLLSLFRLIFDGGGHAALRLPTRHGQLFNPDEFPFLEGRPGGVGRVVGEKFEAPRVSDGCIYRVLHALLVLDGERLSYRALDVEQVGSVYEAMMGYAVERASGRCIAVRPKHVVIDVDALLDVDGAKRVKWLKDRADSDLGGTSATALNTAATPDEVVAALGRRVSPRSLDATGTPRLMAPDTLYLQPGEERRRTGSHYTPRELTEPIVRTTLRPVLGALGERPTPEQILDLKVCDPAMGSGAFLVEACRQLAESLVAAWGAHGATPEMPPDEEPLLHARRLVAQQCLYGVDKNPFAVSLAKLSLWLVTLARDHAFTFIDHALKHGDSLVGLTRKQIAAFHWKTKASDQIDWIAEQTRHDIEEALGWRNALQGFGEGSSYTQKTEAWWEAEAAVADARLIGDLAVAAFFGACKDKDREKLRNAYWNEAEGWRAGNNHRQHVECITQESRDGERSVPPFHWEIEFPEVFRKEHPGFDAMVGNPPFLGGKDISGAYGDNYLAWLLTADPGALGKADLCTHFFHLAGSRSRTCGFLATDSVTEGDTRRSGLERLLRTHARITWAVKSRAWPGVSANVRISEIVLAFDSRLPVRSHASLDGVRVEVINSRLLPGLEVDDPRALKKNAALRSKGIDIGGNGFLVNGEEREKILAREPSSAKRLVPYVGGDELSSEASNLVSRYVIDFRGLSIAQASRWPVLLEIVQNRVRPEREQKYAKRPNAINKRMKERWWHYWADRPTFFTMPMSTSRILVCPQTAKYLTFTFCPSHWVFNQKTFAFRIDNYAGFSVVQSSLHDRWSRRYAGSRGETLSYTVSTAFDTFPFPENWWSDAALEDAGRTYYEFRTELMMKYDEGLTKTYNRFHDRHERDPGIVRLRELHAAMDRAVLDGYGWQDIATDCEIPA